MPQFQRKQQLRRQMQQTEHDESERVPQFKAQRTQDEDGNGEVAHTRTGGPAPAPTGEREDIPQFAPVVRRRLVGNKQQQGPM